MTSINRKLKRAKREAQQYNDRMAQMGNVMFPKQSLKTHKDAKKFYEYTRVLLTAANPETPEDAMKVLEQFAAANNMVTKRRYGTLQVFDKNWQQEPGNDAVLVVQKLNDSDIHVNVYALDENDVMTGAFLPLTA